MKGIAASRKRRYRASGQALMEYVIVMAMFLAVVVMLALFLYVFKEYGGRILDLLASEYP